MSLFDNSVNHSTVLSPGQSQSSVEAAPPTSQSDQSETAVGGGGGPVTLDLESANAIIQQQQSQIQALLQQQQQLQSQASTLLGPALQGLLSQASDSVSIATLVKQTQQLQQCQQLASQQQMTANGDGDPPPAQMSNKVPHSSREPHTEFNTVSVCVCVCVCVCGCVRACVRVCSFISLPFSLRPSLTTLTRGLLRMSMREY